MTTFPTTALEIKKSLQEKKFSSVEITKATLENIKKSDLNAFITIDEKGALEAATLADKKIKDHEKLPLLGVPVAVKDMILTEGLKTTAASKMLSDYIPPYDATVVRKLREAGAVIVGKTNLDEFAMGSSNENSSFGVVKNPWNKEFVPGGSSGGSAASVAGRLVPIALGTDTGGSIRQPASLCGITGMKPTYGKVSRYGAIAFASSLDQIGIFSQTAEDCALALETIAGFDPQDSTSFDKPTIDFEKISKDIKGLKIGIPKELFVDGLENEVRQAIEAGIKTLESLGCTTVPVSLPHSEVGLAVYYVLAPAEAASNLGRYDGIRYGHRADKKELVELYCASRAEGFGAEVKRRIMIGNYVLSSGYYDAYYIKAQRVRRLIQQDYKNAFALCDVIAAPVSPIAGFKIGEKSDDPLQMYLTDIFTIPVSLAGLPGMSIPCGFNKNGLPIGLQLIGRAFDEETLYKTSMAFQAETDFHKQSPGI